jgi:hypothetical protein
MWKRVSPEMDFASARQEFRHRLEHSVGEGFVEPAAGRYQIDFGYYAIMRFNGQHYSGASGMPLQGRHRSKAQQDEPLELLARLRGATDARDVGDETVRGVPCRAVTVSAGAGEYTVCVDEEHIRRVRSKESGPGERPGASITRTLDLWDFGVQDSPADWTHLPSFRTPEEGPVPKGPVPEGPGSLRAE